MCPYYQLVGSSSRFGICWKRPLIYQCLQEDVKRGPEDISADMVGTLMLFHLLTRCDYELFDSHKARRHSKEPSNRELSATSCRSTKLALLDTKYSQDREVHLASTLRSNKISLPLLFTFVVTHSFYLVSHKNTLRFTSDLGSSE